jgi:hypothetical protein
VGSGTVTSNESKCLLTLDTTAQEPNLIAHRVISHTPHHRARWGLGWVEQPHTIEEYQRCGLATAGLEALRPEHPGLSWHTLGGHFQDSRACLGGGG